MAHAGDSVLMVASGSGFTVAYFSRKNVSMSSTMSVRSWLLLSMRRLRTRAAAGSISGSRMMSSKCHCTVSIQHLWYSVASIVPSSKGLLMGVSTLSVTW